MTLFEFCRHLWHQKSLTSIVWRCLRPKFSLSLLYRRVTDTQRDRHTTEHIYCVTIASRGKKSNDEYFPHIQLNKAQRECYDLTLHYLARTANLYILLALISFFSFLMIARRTTVRGSAGPIFTIFSPNDSVLGADDRSGPLLPISRDVAMATNFVEK